MQRSNKKREDRLIVSNLTSQNHQKKRKIDQGKRIIKR